MQKSAPSIARILTMVVFALSCFGLLLFLWLSFGGPIPLKPQGYRVQIAFTDAATLADQADVRVAGVTIGKVVEKRLAGGESRTLTTIELQGRYAPLRADARAILRQKTLLGETYVELTRGSRDAAPVRDGGRLTDGRVAPAVEFDELLRIFDKPTREAFREWQASLAQAGAGRGRDLNDALGNLPAFTENARSVVDVLDSRRAALRNLVRNAGRTFEEISRDEAALTTLVERNSELFGELAVRRNSLADTIRILPTFLEEAKLTLTRLRTFSLNTEPLLRDLEPVLTDLQPTLASLRRLSPDLENLFDNVDPLIDAGDDDLRQDVTVALAVRRRRADAPERRGLAGLEVAQELHGVRHRPARERVERVEDLVEVDGGLGAVGAQPAAVDLDQVFNTFDPLARKAVSNSVEFLRDFQAGQEDEANAALRYLNPALSSSSRLFGQLNRDTSDFRRFIDETAKLVTDVSARDGELSGLVRNLATTASALTSNGESLGESVGLLPNVLRKSNTTFVNLRASLDDLTPLVDDAKPVVRTKLGPLLDELRPFARDAQPAVRDLSSTVRRPGADNDLVELLRRQPALDKIANQTAERNGKDRPGAFPTTVEALDGITKQVAFLRPYAPDLVGWFDDFSTTGAYDALGNFSRAGLQFNGFTLGPALNALPIPAELRTMILAAGTKTGRNNRCPGSIERRAPDGSNPYKPTPDFNCDDTQVPIGP